MAIPIKGLKRTASIAKQIAKSGAIPTSTDEIDRYTGGPALNHISLEYLLSRNVLTLGCILHIFGAEGCGKSTLALDLLSRYFLQPGGNGALIDTESKISTPLVNAVTDEDARADKRFEIFRATKQQAVQAVVTALTKEINAYTFGRAKDDSPHLLGIIIDSFRVASEATQEKIVATGYATKQYAEEANLWRSFLATESGLLLYTPISLIIVNHMVEKEAAYGKVKDHGGGMALKYHETYSILLTKIGMHKSKTEVYTDLTMQTYKNSNGPDKQKISPRIVYKSPDLPEDKVKVDWDIADARLLSGPDVPREMLKKNGVCNVKESSKAGLYSDDVLGLTCVPIEEITAKIYSEPERLAQLRSALNISKCSDLDELWENGWFYGARDAGDFGLEEE